MLTQHPVSFLLKYFLLCTIMIWLTLEFMNNWVKIRYSSDVDQSWFTPNKNSKSPLLFTSKQELISPGVDDDDDVTRVKMKVLLAKQWHARWHDQKTARRWENNIKKVMTLGCQSCGYSSYNSSHRHTHAEMKIYNR